MCPQHIETRLAGECVTMVGVRWRILPLVWDSYLAVRRKPGLFSLLGHSLQKQIENSWDAILLTAFTLCYKQWLWGLAAHGNQLRSLETTDPWTSHLGCLGMMGLSEAFWLLRWLYHAVTTA